MIRFEIIILVLIFGFSAQIQAQPPRVDQGKRVLDTVAQQPLSAYSTLEATERYSLMDCLEHALEGNFSIKISRNQLNVDKNNVSLAPFLPNIGVTARQTQINNHIKSEYADTEENVYTDTRTGNYNVGPSLSWRLFDGFAMFASYAKQKELLEHGELNFRASVETLVMELSNQYYQIITLQNQVDLVKQLVAISRLRYEQALLKYNIGSLSGLECQQARIYLNADSSSLILQKQSLKNAYVQLYRMMGVPFESKVMIQDTIAPETRLELGALQESVLKKNTELLLMRQGQVISEYDLKLARASRYPSLDFSTGYNLSLLHTPLSASVRNTETKGYNWGFSLSIPIFSGFTVNRQVKNAKLGVERATLQYEQVEQALMSTLLQEYNIYTDNVQMIEFEQESAEVAYSNMEAAVEKYRLGSLSGIEFREIQISYLNSVDRKLRAIYQAKLSEVALLLLAGEIYR